MSVGKNLLAGRCGALFEDASSDELSSAFRDRGTFVMRNLDRYRSRFNIHKFLEHMLSCMEAFPSVFQMLRTDENNPRTF